MCSWIFGRNPTCVANMVFCYFYAHVDRIEFRKITSYGLWRVCFPRRRNGYLRLLRPALRSFGRIKGGTTTQVLQDATRGAVQVRTQRIDGFLAIPLWNVENRHAPLHRVTLAFGTDGSNNTRLPSLSNTLQSHSRCCLWQMCSAHLRGYPKFSSVL